jgi:hypothetical protein
VQQPSDQQATHLRQLLLILEGRPDLLRTLSGPGKLQQLCELLCHANLSTVATGMLGEAEAAASALLRWPRTLAAICQQVWHPKHWGSGFSGVCYLTCLPEQLSNTTAAGCHPLLVVGVPCAGHGVPWRATSPLLLRGTAGAAHQRVPCPPRSAGSANPLPAVRVTPG